MSVVLATYNVAGLVGRALESVAAHLPLAEVVVADGGSDDGTAEIAERVGGSQVSIVSERDRGVYDALNKAVARSSRDFVYCLGADDTVEPGVQALCSAATARDTAYYGDVLWGPGGARYAGRFTSRHLLEENICHQAMLYPRDFLLSVGGYDLRYPQLADYALVLRAWFGGLVRFEHVDTVVATYAADGMSTRTTDEAFARDKDEIVASAMRPLRGSAFRARRRASAYVTNRGRG